MPIFGRQIDRCPPKPKVTSQVLSVQRWMLPAPEHPLPEQECEEHQVNQTIEIYRLTVYAGSGYQ